MACGRDESEKTFGLHIQTGGHCFRTVPTPQPLRQTRNVVIFLGCLFLKTEAIAKGSGGNKWQANAETGRGGEET